MNEKEKIKQLELKIQKKKEKIMKKLQIQINHAHREISRYLNNATKIMWEILNEKI